MTCLIRNNSLCPGGRFFQNTAHLVAASPDEAGGGA